MINEKIQQIEEYAKTMMADEAAHGFSHVNRVRKWALQIAKDEKYQNLEMVETAALLHDIGLSSAKKRSLHGEAGAKLAISFLSENNFFSADEIFEVSNAILFHCKNREGKGELLNIIRDADMMDLFGAMGILRACTSKFSNAEYNPINIKGETWKMTAQDFDQRFDSGVGIGEFIVDQINFQISCYGNLSTDAAKKLAGPLIEFAKKFVLELETEVETNNI
ncbi:MAG: HD domain-containing protein [Patescibacteria group bacterium]